MEYLTLPMWLITRSSELAGPNEWLLQMRDEQPRGHAPLYADQEY